MRDFLIGFKAVLLVAVCFCAAAAHAENRSASLSQTDAKLLDGLVKDFLFDPKGAERVVVPIVLRSVWGHEDNVQVEAWLKPAADGMPSRAYLTDGASLPAPEAAKINRIDFVTSCKQRYAEKPAVADDSLDGDAVFRRMDRAAVGIVGEDDLALAAWLHRLGHDELASRALAEARREKQDALKRLRDELAWSAFAGLVHAYMVRADEEALGHGERLLRLYADEAEADYPQAEQLIAELNRRKRQGTFGKAPAEKPPGFDNLTADEQVKYFVKALDEVDARQHGQPGGVDLASDPRVAALIKIGDAAVPALLDVLEHDERLTRSVHFWRDFSRNRTVLAVREAALVALMSILHEPVFEPSSTGDNLTARGTDKSQELVRRLRDYWAEYGRMPLEDRMMKVLTSPSAGFDAKRNAADNLAHLGASRAISTTVFSDHRGETPRRKNPAVAKFDSPTVAEAILAAFDAELISHDDGPVDDLHDYRRRQIEEAYLVPLADLGDKRIASEMARRSLIATNVRMRRKFAFIAHQLGDAAPFRRFADDVRTGKVRLPQDDAPNVRDSEQPANVELYGIVSYLAAANTAEADAALSAIADPRHPYFKLVADRVLDTHAHSFDEAAWFSHPYCLQVLRSVLDETTGSGTTYSVENGDRLVESFKSGQSTGPLPHFLRNPADRREKVEGRVCDGAAARISELLIGLPPYHPLLKDAEERLAQLKAEFDRYAGRYRRLTSPERDVLGLHFWDVKFIPAIVPLGRAATTDDVANGKAVFHLEGRGRTTDLQLPAQAILKNSANAENPTRVLIVQAEIDAGAGTVYGALWDAGIRRLAEAEVGEVTPLVPSQPTPEPR